MSKRLETEVWNMERCAGCGACITACDKRILSVGDDGDHPSKRTIKKRVGLTSTLLDACHFCDMKGERLCELSCPRLQEEWEEGTVLEQWLVHTTGKHVSGDSNDIIANLLAGAMEAGMIDGAVITDVDRWSLVPYPRVAATISDVIQSVGNQYIWSPTLTGLKEAVYKKGLENLAVVGAPCNMQALESMTCSGSRALRYITGRIRLKVGTFCTGMYKPEALRQISKALDIPLTAIQRISVFQSEDDLVVHTFNGKKKSMKLSDATSLIRAGCGRCYDLVSEQADISVGPIGGRDGMAVIIVRTPAGQTALENAVGLKLLALSKGVDETALTEAKEAKKRRKRAELMDGLQVLMLEALRDHSKVEEAKRRFGELYYRRILAGKSDLKEEEAASGCGGCTGC